MIYDKEYRDCALIICEPESINIIAKTIIADYDRTSHTISVNEINFSLNDSPSVLLYIFYGESVYKFMGTVRRMSLLPLREISIYKGELISDRRAKRYPAKITAVVDDIICDEARGRVYRLDPPLEVTMINISSTGALLQTSSTGLALGLRFKLKLIIGETSTCINTSIVRINKEENNKIEYGCKFHYIYD